ncbi:MAG: CRISPR-associated protein Cas4 [Balneolales bacterium]
MNKPVIPTLLNYYMLCRRKAWFFAHGIQMEHTSDIVSEGKVISETTYGRRSSKYTELDLGIAKIDYYDAKNKVVHEVKKSNKVEHAHEWQVKYYLYLLGQNGVEGASGILEYPKLRRKTDVELTDEDRSRITTMISEIQTLVSNDECPPLQKKSICRSCSYFDLCWSGEGA